MTWGIWALLGAIAATAALSAGALQTAILTGIATVNCATIFVMSFKRGIKSYSWFDVACLIVSVAGIAAWQLTGNPAIAVGLAIAANLVAALPTWRHAWIAPFAETWQGFALAAGAGALTLLSLTSYTFVALAFPVFMVVSCLTMTGIVLPRRRLARASAKRGAEVVKEVVG